MPIDVSVTEQCDRCKRKEQITISSDKVAEFEAKAEAAKANEQAMLTFVEAQQGALPDLVVIFKGVTSMLSNVCDAYCAKTVQSSIETLFRAPKERRPRRQMTDAEKAAAKIAREAKAKEAEKVAAVAAKANKGAKKK